MIYKYLLKIKNITENGKLNEKIIKDIFEKKNWKRK
jgi:hypothetical protein